MPEAPPLPELPSNNVIGSRSDMMIEMARRDGLTLRQLYQVFAASRGGFVLVPLNWRLAPGEWAFILEDAGSPGAGPAAPQAALPGTRPANR